MTRDEFIELYARRSKVTVAWLLSRMDAVPCDCGEACCNGWQMIVK